MPELNDGDLHLVINIAESISFVVHNELENTKTPRGLQLVSERRRFLVWLFKSYLIVGIQHSELELDIISDEWHPLAINFLVDVHKVLNVYLSLVILGVDSIPGFTYFVVSNILDLQNTSLMEVPLNHLGAKLVVGGRLDGVIDLCSKHSLVAAHLQ